MEEQQKNTDKLTDKAFSRLMLTSVLGILLCIACLCSATWAWFSADVSSNENTLKAGVFDLAVSVTDASAQPVTVTHSANGAYACSLGTAVYTVKLAVSEDTTVTKGYCVITINGTAYKTATLEAGVTESISFTLDVQNAEITVSFMPSWGMPAHYDIEEGTTLTVGEQND